MFRSALDIAQVTQTSQASWATTWLNLGSSLRKLGRLDEASSAYIKVLEIDSRSAPALGFLGLVYHLMDRLGDAIVRYHEVSTHPLPLSVLCYNLFFPRFFFLFLFFFPIVHPYLPLTSVTLFEVEHTNGTNVAAFRALSIGPVDQPD